MLTKLRHSRPVGLARYHLYRDILLAWPRLHACNICGWRGRRFLTYLHRHVLCRGRSAVMPLEPASLVAM